ETSGDGASLILLGTVEGPAEARAAIELTGEFAGRPEAAHAPAATVDRSAPNAPTQVAAVIGVEAPPAGVVNLLRFRNAPPRVEDRIAAELKAIAPDLTVRRGMRGVFGDDP